MMQKPQPKLESVWEGDTVPKLGDELRGARYTKGVSIEQIAEELRLKPSYIDAIENHDLSAFPSQAFISGYVRSYAKYLDLNAEQTLARFNRENNIQSKSVVAPREEHINQSSTWSKSKLPFNAGAVVKFALVCLLFGGVLTGLGAVVKNLFLTPTQTFVQEAATTQPQDQVTTPALMYDATDIATINSSHATSAASYDDLVRSSVVKPDRALFSDGPIAAIAPPSNFASIGETLQQSGDSQPKTPEPTAADDEWSTQIQTTPIVTQDIPTVARQAGFTLTAVQDSWIRLRNDQGTVFQGLLKSGEEFASDIISGPLYLTMGNAGGVYVKDAQATYGPLGKNGQVVSNLRLDPKQLEALAPIAKILDTTLE